MSKGKTKLPADFAISPTMRTWADTKVPTLDVDYYHDEFCDHWASTGKMMVSWEATWRNWMRRTDNCSAPGVFPSNVVRKKPRAVQTNGQLELSPQEQHWQRMDKLRNRAIGLGMPLVVASKADEHDLTKWIKESDSGAAIS